MKGRITKTGYRRNSPDVGNDFNIIPSNRISMRDVDFPVLGIDNLGNTQLMHPGGEYEYQGDYVTELPMYGSGGLTQWFAEEWVDIKTGKKCGRSGKDKKGRPYPACRPSKRVNKTTPKTRGEMSAAEKAKFKRKKKSGKRIDYNHKRAQLGGGLDPEMLYRNRYNTELTASEKKEFDKWVAEESKRQGRDILMDMGAYDVQGFWKSGDHKRMDQDNHGTDTWKKPNHPTFSNQSKYHGADGFYGGNWTEDGGYQPSKQTLEMYGSDYYDWMFGLEPNRPEHLDISRYESGVNRPTPLYYQKGGSPPKTQEGNDEVISLSTSDPRYAEYYNRLNDDVVLADPSGKTAGRIFLDEVDVVADKATPPAFNFQGYTTTAVQDGIAQQTPFRFSPEGIAAEKSYQEYQDYIKSLPYDQRPGYIQPTISEYVPPSTAEWWWDKISNPMTSLGYVMRGQTDIMPDRVGNQPRNAFDYALDIVNPAAYINTVGDVYENLSEGDVVGAGLDAITLAPIVPTAARQAKNLVPSIKAGARYTGNKIAKGYNKVATGNSVLPIAWKMEDASTFVPTSSIKTTATLADDEAKVIGKYLQDPYIKNPESFNYNPLFDQVVQKNKGIYDNISVPFTRVEGYASKTTPIPSKYGSTFSYDGSKSWSLGARFDDKNLANLGKTRLVIPSRYSKGLDFMPIDYTDARILQGAKEQTLKLGLDKFAPGVADDLTRFVPENEIIGNVSNGFKVIGRSNEQGFNNIFIKPIKQLGGSLPLAQFGGRPGDVFQEVDTYIKPGQRIRPDWTHSPVSVTNYTFGKTLADDEPRFSLSVQGTDILDEIKYRADAIGSVGIGVGNRKGKSFRPAGENLRAGIRGQASWQGVPGNVIENMFGRRSGLDWRGSFEGEAGVAYANGAVRPYMSVMPQTNVFLNDNLSLGIGYEMRGRYDKNFDEPVYGNTDTGSIAPVSQRDAYSGMGRGAARFSLNYDLGNGDFIEGYYAKPDPLYQGSMPGIREMLALESEQPRFGIRLRKSFNKGGQLPSYQTRGEVNFQSLDPRLQNGYNSTDATYVRQDIVDPYIVNRSETQRLIDNSVPQTATTYIPPAPNEWFLNKAANPVATLGYIARGQRIPDRINNDDKENALDYAFDIINPAAWANYAVEAEKDFLRGDIVGGTLNAVGAIPAVPAAAGTATKTTFNLAKGTPIKSSFNLAKTAAPVSKPATLISGRLPEGVKKWIKGLDQGQVPEYIMGLEKGAKDVLGIGVPRRPFFETFPITRSQRLKVQGLQDAAALEAEAFVKAYTHDGTQLQPWVVSKLQDWAPGATWQTNLRNQPHLRNKRVVLTDTRPGRRSSLLTDENLAYINRNRSEIGGFAPLGERANMVTFRNQGWYFNRPSEIANVVAHEGAHGLPQSILDIRGVPLGNHMSPMSPGLGYFANPAYNPAWASQVTEAHNVTKKFLHNPFKNRSKYWEASPIEFDAEKLATRFKLYKDWQSKGANMSPETFLRLESESINPFRLNKIPGMSGPIGFDPEAFQAYYRGQLSGHLINPNMPVRDFNTMNKFYRIGGQLPTYQTKGETPLTRDEVFNIPRTVRYENGKMILQDKPIYDGMLDEVTITPTTASEYAWQENRANQSTGGLEPIYPIFDLMSSGLRAPLTKGAKAVQGALTSEKTLGALARSPYVPKFTKPGLIKNYKSKFPNVDLRGAGTGNYSKLGVNELGLGVDDFGSLTNYERSAISQVNQTQPADEVFNTFVQRYADFNTDDALANQLADFARRNPRTKFEMNLGRDVAPSKRMQEIFNDPELNVHNVFSYKSSGPMNPVNKWGNESRLFYDSSARNAAGEFEKNLRSYGEQGFYAANVPMGKPVRQALTYNKDGRVFDYVTETLPVSDFVVNKGLMNPDVIGNFSRYRGAGDMANQHNFLLGITNSPSVIISGNKGFAGLKGGNQIREKIGGLITPTGGKAVPSHNTQVVPLLKQEFNLSKPFEGTFMKSPGVLETYYNSRGQASPYTNFPGILDIDDLFTTGKSNYAKGGQLPKAQEGNGEKHTVASGETFYGIANKHGVEWQDLIDANPDINPDKLSVGQSINLPGQFNPNYVLTSKGLVSMRPDLYEAVPDVFKNPTFIQAELDKLDRKNQANNKNTSGSSDYFPEGLLLKQAYKESTFNPAAQSNIKNPAQGFAQFRPITVKELQRLGFADSTFDPFDYTQSIGAQRDYMNYLYNRPWINKPNQSEEVRLAKTLAAYNWGPTVFENFLTNKKAAGVDIYNSLDWVDQLPGETGDYINKILLDSDEQFQANYQKAIKDTANLKYINLYNLKTGGEPLPVFDDYDTFDRAWLAARKKLGRGKQFMYGGKVRSTDT